MKKYLPGLTLLLMGFTTPPPAAPVDKLGVPGPLRFGKTPFYLAWSGQANSNSFTQEYLPKGERVDRFQQMLTVAVITNVSDIKAVVNAKVNELEARKQTDAVCNYQVLSNPDKQEIILDFLVSQDITQPQGGVVEFNVYRYQQLSLGGGKTGTLLYFYSKRSYGSNIDSFLKSLPPVRAEAIATMAAAAMPVIKLIDKK